MRGRGGGVEKFGEYLVDEIEISRGIIDISARALGTEMAFKQKKSKIFESLQISDIISEICTENGYSAKFSSDVTALTLGQKLAQLAESDLNVLQRLSRKFALSFKFIGTDVFFKKRLDGRSLLGSKTPEIIIDKKDLFESWAIKISRREIYTSVSARIINFDSGDNYIKKFYGDKRKNSAAEDGASYLLSGTFSTEKEAEIEAWALLRNKEAENITGTFMVRGNPKLRAESVISISGIKNALNGAWFVEKAHHAIKDGYVTTIFCTKRGLNET